mmetsp:Transcript_121976/g.279421  ORF Transcript_121976/g.279421 Transcript_121976/m.279421 type:complete len:219 (+) Transcript_121976:354-1010(+)
MLPHTAIHFSMLLDPPSNRLRHHFKPSLHPAPTKLQETPLCRHPRHLLLRRLHPPLQVPCVRGGGLRSGATPAPCYGFFDGAVQPRVLSTVGSIRGPRRVRRAFRQGEVPGAPRSGRAGGGRTVGGRRAPALLGVKHGRDAVQELVLPGVHHKGPLDVAPGVGQLRAEGVRQGRRPAALASGRPPATGRPWADATARPEATGRPGRSVVLQRVTCAAL